MQKSMLVHNSVLLVEDDPLEAELARCAAAGHGALDLTVMTDGDEALAWVAGQVEKKRPLPSIILMDLKLPKLIGLALLRRFRMDPATQNIPIVVFSSEYTQADVLMSYQVGANSFVGKPADQQQFSDFLREQLAYWLEPRSRELEAAR